MKKIIILSLLAFTFTASATEQSIWSKFKTTISDFFQNDGSSIEVKASDCGFNRSSYPGSPYQRSSHPSSGYSRSSFPKPTVCFPNEKMEINNSHLEPGIDNTRKTRIINTTNK